MNPDPITACTFTEHAPFEMARRGVTEEAVRAVLERPEQRLAMRPGRDVVQSRVGLGAPAKTYLLRVIIDITVHPAAVVTVYRTSKIAKYWSDES